MSPATSTKVRRRQAARKDAFVRQQKLNEERRRRDEQELELAADFALRSEECVAAQQAVRAAELEMGRIVEELIGGLRVRYPRVAQLLDMPEDELRRVRQLAADSLPDKESATDRAPRSDGGQATTTPRVKRGTPRAAREPAGPERVTAAQEASTEVVDPAAGGG